MKMFAKIRLEALALVVLIAVMLQPFCGGCGSAIDTQRELVEASAVVIAQGSETIYAAQRAKIAEACPQSLMHDAFIACATSTGAVWQMVETAVHAVREALIAWLDALDIAEAAGQDEDGDPLVRVALEAGALLVRTYQSLVALLRPHNVTIPSLPEMLVSIANGIGGGR